MEAKDWSFILNHLGEDRENYFNAVSPPIIQSSNFAFRNVEHFRESISDEMEHTIYTRGVNPSVNILRKKLAALEGTEDALIFSSGSAAIAAAMMSQLASGDHVVCVKSPYSWTHSLLTKYLTRFGVTTDFVDGTKLESIEEAIRANTKILYLESPNTFYFELQDLEACTRIARKHGLVTMIDNSFASPVLQNPADFGIDLVIHSATKYLNGHSDVVAGVVCGSKKLIKQIFENEYMTLGPIISPADATLVTRGLRTLLLRVHKSSESGQEIANWLAELNCVSAISYPFHPTHPQYELAIKQMRGGGGLITCYFKSDSKAQMQSFIDSLKMFLIAVSWGGHESLVMPAVAFHDVKNRPDSAYPIHMVRFYIGLEDPKLLMKDIENALHIAKLWS